ncbi:hypothetical protein MML48_9g00002252 [Holotrichia oblita]|uniref:Uncharacterized protein n=1 Tax=Holotrichia oblita TaxID=644536 RepID=A0ACB9SKW1_HOLOL|nr:hypothetical protein MML48_9g00002252 [Holotrichia oblita]
MNRDRKRTLWFCNNPLSPVITPTTNSNIQDTTITTSDESIKNTSTASSSLARQNEEIDQESTASYEISRQSEITFDTNKYLEENSDKDEVTELSLNSVSGVRKKKTNFCYFCVTSVTNFARHLSRNHKLEFEVQKMLSFPVNSKNRKEQLTLLRKKGNHLNNNDKIKPMRDTNSNSNYLPCVHCVGYYSSKSLRRHRKYCSENPEAGKSTAVQTQVFPHMRAEKISLTVKKDPLICAFAARYIKIHREMHFISVASRKMREIGKLLIEMKKLQSSIKTLFDALQPQHYDLLVTATKDVAKYNREDFYESATYAITWGLH